MNLNPTVNTNNALVFAFVGEQAAVCPPDTAVDHVKDNVFVDEYQVTLDLLVELVWEVDVDCVAGAWLGPFSTYSTCFACFRNEVENFVRHANTFEELDHRICWCVPPPDM